MRSYCGKLNSKNAFGGYVGYQPFYYVVMRVFSRAHPHTNVGIQRDIGFFETAREDQPNLASDIKSFCHDGARVKEADLLGIEADF